jgi:hypothetical protein
VDNDNDGDDHGGGDNNGGEDDVEHGDRMVVDGDNHEPENVNIMYTHYHPPHHQQRKTTAMRVQTNAATNPAPHKSMPATTTTSKSSAPPPSRTTSASTTARAVGAKRVAAAGKQPTSSHIPISQSTKITRRAGVSKVEFTPAASSSSRSTSTAKSTSGGGGGGGGGGGIAIELDDSVAKLLAEHNKKFKPKATYEPRKFGVKEIRDWEKKSGLQWYNLNAAERARANEEIEQMRAEARHAALTQS